MAVAAAGRVLTAVTRAMAPAGDAASALAAAALVGAELGGHREFGLVLLDGLADGGRAASQVRPAPVVHDDGPRASLDGRGLFGPVAAAQAAVAALDRVERHGVAVVTILGLGRLGRLAPYVGWLAERGVVALLAANAPAAVAPAGGHQPVLGTNPLAAALPVRGGVPLVVDTATAAITQAAVRAAARDGVALPPGTALDAAGAPTTDAAAVHALVPRGGAFGSAVGLVVETLAAGLTGVASFSGAPRSAVLLAFAAAPGADVVGGELVGRWEHAGGHVPGSTSGPVPGESATVEVPAAVAEILDRLAPGW